jgi:hypothetical protein
MFVGEVSANKGEGIITIGARGQILRRAEVGQYFLDDCRDTSKLCHGECNVYMHREMGAVLHSF